jgi:elongation factor Ts
MAEISATLVKELREKTGAGMMDCKKALAESGGDLEKAIEYLRKKGSAIAAKRADRETKEGLVYTLTSPDKKQVVIVEVNCETDFVARNQDFTGFTKAVAELIAKKNPADVTELLATSFDGVYENKSVAEVTEMLIAKIGEKIAVKRFAVLKAESGITVDYVHPGSKLAAVVHLASDTANHAEELLQLGKDIAMQVAASSPLVVERSQVAKDKIEKEIEIYKQQATNDGKPAGVIERIATGKLEKFYQDVVLLEQAFIKDNGKTVTDILKEASEKSKSKITVTHFERFQLGEVKH